MTFAATWLQERYYWLMPFLQDLAAVAVCRTRAYLTWQLFLDSSR